MKGIICIETNEFFCSMNEFVRIVGVKRYYADRQFKKPPFVVDGKSYRYATNEEFYDRYFGKPKGTGEASYTAIQESVKIQEQLVDQLEAVESSFKETSVAIKRMIKEIDSVLPDYMKNMEMDYSNENKGVSSQ